MRLAGIAEMAEAFGVSKQVISNWKKRGHLPPPLADLQMSPVWNLDSDEVQAVMKVRGKKSEGAE